MRYTEGTVIGSIIWSIDIESSILNAIDISSGEIISTQKLDENDRKLRYEMIENINDQKLLIAPFLSDDFLVFDLITNDIRKIRVDWNKSFKGLTTRYEQERKIGKLIKADNVIYAIGFSIPGIVIINIETEKYDIKSYMEYIDMNKSYNLFSECCLLTFKNGICMRDYLIFPLGSESVLLKISREGRCIEKIDLGTEYGIVAAIHHENNIYCLDFNNNLIVIDEYWNKEVYSLSENQDCELLFSKIIEFNNEIFLIPYFSDKIWKIRKRDRKIFPISIDSSQKIITAFKDENNIYMFNNQRFELIYINKECQITRKKLVPSNEQYTYLLEKKEILKEEIFGLQRFLSLI